MVTSPIPLLRIHPLTGHQRPIGHHLESTSGIAAGDVILQSKPAQHRPHDFVGGDRIHTVRCHLTIGAITGVASFGENLVAIVIQFDFGRTGRTEKGDHRHTERTCYVQA
jgi:hypothetical protein